MSKSNTHVMILLIIKRIKIYIIWYLILQYAKTTLGLAHWSNYPTLISFPSSKARQWKVILYSFFSFTKRNWNVTTFIKRHTCFLPKINGTQSIWLPFHKSSHLYFTLLGDSVLIRLRLLQWARQRVICWIFSMNWFEYQPLCV